MLPAAQPKPAPASAINLPRTAPCVVLFDLDDTLLRFSAGQPDFWGAAVRHHLPQHPQPGDLLAAIARVSGDFWSEPTRAFWGRQNMYEARRQIVEQALAEWRVAPGVCHTIADHMTDAKEAAVAPFEGAVETLQQLRDWGIRLALLTNGCSVFQRRKLARYALEPFFDLVLIEGELGYGKPNAKVFAGALTHFNVAPQACWMIGDNLEADIAGAQALGIYGVWHDPEGRGLPKANPTLPAHTVRRVSELLPLIGARKAQ